MCVVVFCLCPSVCAVSKESVTTFTHAHIVLVIRLHSFSFFFMLNVVCLDCLVRDVV